MQDTNKKGSIIGDIILWCAKLSILSLLAIFTISNPMTYDMAERIGIQVPGFIKPYSKLHQKVTGIAEELIPVKPISTFDLPELSNDQYTEEDKTEIKNRISEFDNGTGSNYKDQVERKLQKSSDKEMSDIPKILSSFGLQPAYGFDKMTECDIGSVDTSNVVAMVCDAMPNRVFIKDQETTQKHGFNSALRHEIAHTQILKTCGTYSPPSVNDRAEAVTSSYAILFLGADREELNSIADPNYMTDHETDRMAKDIRNGVGCKI